MVRCDEWFQNWEHQSTTNMLSQLNFVQCLYNRTGIVAFLDIVAK